MSEQQIEQVLEKNPDLVLKAIEKRPEQFMQVINNVALKAQEAERFRKEAELKSKVASEQAAKEMTEQAAKDMTEQKSAIDQNREKALIRGQFGSGESQSPGKSE